VKQTMANGTRNETHKMVDGIENLMVTLV